MDFGLVLRRPIEITRVTGHEVFSRFHLSGFRVYQDPASKPSHFVDLPSGATLR